MDDIAVPLKHRWLWLDGQVASRFESAVRKGIPCEWPSTSRICFVGYAYADLPLPKDFDMMFAVKSDEYVCGAERDDCTRFRPHYLASAVAVPSRILAATQQFSKPEREIPGGWKTICLIDFPEGVPEMVDKLPHKDGWGMSREYVCLCAYETWSALVDTASC